MSSTMIRWANRVLVLGLMLIMVSSAQAVRKNKDTTRVINKYAVGFRPACGYMSFGVINRSLEGNFYGNTYYEVINGYTLWQSMVPKFESATGFRGSLGFRGRIAAMEFSGAYTKHTGMFDIYPVDGSFLTVGMDMLFYVNNHSRIQPFLQAGLMYQKVTVEDGSIRIDYNPWIDEFFVKEGDGSYRGLGWRFGGGVQFYLNKSVSVRATALLRTGSLNRLYVVGLEEAIELDEGIDASGLSLHMQAFLGFW